MKKVILIPDSFKGTMSAGRVCEIMEQSIRKRFPACEIIRIPVADGGEGTVDCFLEAVGGKRQSLRVTGPLGERMESFYGILEDEEHSAVIEMAACAGLPLVEGRENPEKTGTYGVGELIRDALDKGCRHIIVGLGGSATNDGGCGMAAALGVRFLDREGRAFVPTGGTLKQISRIDMTGLEPRLRDCTITAMCDIDNPMCGPRGAAHVFGPQKGADESMVARLEEGLRHLSVIVERDLGEDICCLPGAGAAGGMGGGVAAFLKAGLESGIDTMLNASRFDGKLAGTDYVFTGEGRLDGQSMMGKVVGGVAKRTSARHVPLVVVAGSVDESAESIYASGVTAAFSINRKPLPFEEARKYSEENLAAVMGDILRLLESAGAGRVG